ncbi:MAG TPA: single-stranded-DNA-specific exonuclease RecJ [Dehalococcoidia bacterium]|nr:single-stranded-DNA-specific exonuclease RecJ [Dehalococcoidia bacterium]
MTLAPEIRTATGKRWRLRGRFPDGALDGAPYQPLIRHLLWHRGVRTVAQAVAFTDAADPRHDVTLLPDINAALARLGRAIKEGELIAVYGDFDVDGVTASAILLEGLAELGAKVMPYIPDRFTEGYGVNTRAIESLHGAGAAVMITADCGTSSVVEIGAALALGVDTIVLDHHTVPPELPPAVAIVNPKRTDSEYPEPELSSGGLAIRLIEALYDRLGRSFDAGRYLDLVALSTVCDMAPLRGENRWLVREGLRALAKTQRPGLRALMETAGCDPARADASTIGFVIGPRLNAAGRLDHARKALELLMEKDEGRAREMALNLATLNQQRQAATSAACELARELVSADDPDAALIFVGHRDIPSGIVGLVAARLLEDHYKPAVVYEEGETNSRASCRSIPEFDITAALRTVPELMERFGGHRAAAGFTAQNANLPALKAALQARAAEELAGVDLVSALEVDAAVPLGRINGEFIRSLAALAPFGMGNPEPVFLSRGLEVRDIRVMGGDGQHLRLALKDGRVTWPAVAFGVRTEEGTIPGDLQVGGRIDAVYTFSTDRGSDGAMELRLLDFAPSD